ncbi:hypothetical protein DICPUDRAFT_50845 [Dictyostelium purpureum]|uniref:Follistatin-like domain-containing protein n=1 Tax=Dictyostelium purpureum TaxID=5786 RepID=F1A0N0_DICPU|nr:uncharacterized protein DICPUDRAFT_50845 [Dictyostelium purpureum]EGC30251.1 hypothetical protein DICPUDRAFT_50845 [Dictyostelium purpureum]|eukprot:XP_003293223.1 hypothetical protein DICPUDRAFT_50845 [Dictyostelium purpureum]
MKIYKKFISFALLLSFSSAALAADEIQNGQNQDVQKLQQEAQHWGEGGDWHPHPSPPPPRGCDYLSENECKAPGSGCQYLPFVSCCGVKRFFCVKDNGSGCGNAPLTCVQDTKSNAIYELWSQCRPNLPELVDFKPLNSTCDQKSCESRGGSCQWKEPVPCMGTSCCPRFAECSADNNGGGNQDVCKNVLCPDGYVCEGIHGGAYCVEKPHPPPPPPTSPPPHTHHPHPHPHSLCDGVKCEQDKECIVNKENAAICVPKHHRPPHTRPPHTRPPHPPPKPECLCDKVSCPKGFNCIEFDGQANCVESTHEECLRKHCPPGYDCEVNWHGEAHCVRPPPDHQCHNVTCPPFHVCKIINGETTCIRKPLPPAHQCRDLRCPPGYMCTLISNVPTCVKAPSPPPPSHCLTCRDVECGSLSCHIVPNKCPRGSGPNSKCCPYIPSCVRPGWEDSSEEEAGVQCGPFIQCKHNEICLLNEQRCASLCDYVECSRGSQCIVKNGIPQCLERTIF